MTWPISLFTACSPWLPLDKLAPLAAAAGFQGLDLAVKPHRYDGSRPPCFWNNNAAVLDLDRLDEQVPQVAQILAQHGLECRVLCSYLQPTELAQARRLAMAAQILQAPLVRIWSPTPKPGQAAAQVATARGHWRELAAMAADHNSRFVLELHDGTITTGASGALRLLDACDPTRVGVILDVANTANQGNEPLDLAVDLLGPYLAHVHVKDLAWQPANTWNGLSSSYTDLGQGSIRWPACMRILRQAGYTGWMAVENFTGLERGPERIRDDLHWMQACITDSKLHSS